MCVINSLLDFEKYTDSHTENKIEFGEHFFEGESIEQFCDNVNISFNDVNLDAIYQYPIIHEEFNDTDIKISKIIYQYINENLSILLLNNKIDTLTLTLQYTMTIGKFINYNLCKNIKKMKLKNLYSFENDFEIIFKILKSTEITHLTLEYNEEEG